MTARPTIRRQMILTNFAMIVSLMILNASKPLWSSLQVYKVGEVPIFALIFFTTKPLFIGFLFGNDCLFFFIVAIVNIDHTFSLDIFLSSINVETWLVFST